MNALDLSIQLAQRAIDMMISGEASSGSALYTAVTSGDWGVTRAVLHAADDLVLQWELRNWNRVYTLEGRIRSLQAYIREHSVLAPR